MANKGTTMPADAGDFKGEAAANDPETAKLAEQHRAANEKKQKTAERRSNVSDELYKRHKKLIASKRKELSKAQEVVSSINGQLRELYATAKDDGINIVALKDFFKLEEMDPDELQENMRDVARIARVTNSPLLQLKLFDEGLDDDKSDIAPRARGFSVGKAGGNKGDNPFKPGSEDFVEWDGGYDEGQAAIGVGTGAPPMKPKTGNGNKKLN